VPRPSPGTGFSLAYSFPVTLRWIHKVWLRVIALLFAASLLVLGVVSVTAAPVWPIVGVAVATVAVMWTNITSRLDRPTCLHCGHDIENQPGSQYGIVCDKCGGLSEPVGARTAKNAAETYGDESQSSASERSA
jgi:hypothetical protein